MSCRLTWHAVAIACLFAALIASVYGDFPSEEQCNMEVTCTSCLQREFAIAEGSTKRLCGWCSETQQCMPCTDESCSAIMKCTAKDSVFMFPSYQQFSSDYMNAICGCQQFSESRSKCEDETRPFCIYCDNCTQTYTDGIKQNGALCWPGRTLRRSVEFWSTNITVGVNGNGDTVDMKLYIVDVTDKGGRHIRYGYLVVAIVVLGGAIGLNLLHKRGIFERFMNARDNRRQARLGSDGEEDIGGDAIELEVLQPVEDEVVETSSL